MVEGSALGGRLLARGLDPLLGPESPEGRHFLSARGPATGGAWRDYLQALAALDHAPKRRTVVFASAIQTFDVFEVWLEDWSAKA